ncbi:MAG: hypothetical protein JWR50_367 [Mucilaginibacter sp.]|nr:hypothetical protein [Mucilaginibacter sp.]
MKTIEPGKLRGFIFLQVFAPGLTLTTLRLPALSSASGKEGNKKIQSDEP